MYAGSSNWSNCLIRHFLYNKAVQLYRKLMDFKVLPNLYHWKHFFRVYTSAHITQFLLTLKPLISSPNSVFPLWQLHDCFHFPANLFTDMAKKRAKCKYFCFICIFFILWHQSYKSEKQIPEQWEEENTKGTKMKNRSHLPSVNLWLWWKSEEFLFWEYQLCW